MTSDKQDTQSEYLKVCREDLREARASEDECQIALTMANLGFALFQVKKYKEGIESFDEALDLAGNQEGPQIQIQILGIKTLAFQESNRLLEAYKTTDEILRMAEKHDEAGIMCDALLSQTQILLDSGEPTLAFEKLNDARQIAQQIDDKRRLMNVLGALGNYSLVVISLNQAQAYFDKALGLARDLGDQRAEYGFLGNKGMVLAWQGKSDQAATTLEQVVSYIREQGETEAEVSALRHLVQVYGKLENDGKVLEHAQRGLELVDGSENEVAFTFLEAQILAYYRMNLVEAAHQKTSEAIELAQSRGDLKKEFEMRLSLAEACIVSGELEAALEKYTQALEMAKRLNHKKDEARLTGRIGFTLAEMGRLDEAVPYHQRAVKLARDRDIPDLEGEQLSMLAIAYMDKRELEEAKEYALKAVEVYEGAELVDEAEKARSLISQMENSNP